MAEKLVKIQANQNLFSNSQNRVDWMIPAEMGVCDLRETYAHLHLRVTCSDPDAVYPCQVRWKNGATVYDNLVPNSAYVKNAYVSSDLKGQIENERRCDILSNLRFNVENTLDNMMSMSYMMGASPVYYGNKQVCGLLPEKNKVGTALSRQPEDVILPVRLGEVLDFFNADAPVDMAKLGRTRVHFELNHDKISVQPCNSLANALAGSLAFQDVTATANSIQTKAKFANLDESPYYTNQKIHLASTGAGGATNLNADVVITAISWQADGTLVLTLDTNITLGAGESQTDIVASAPTAVTFTFELTQAELVLKQIAGESASVIAYSKYECIETNGNGLTGYVNGIEVNGAGTAVMILPLGADGLTSIKDDVTEYRLRIDNHDLSDRPVQIQTPLAFNRLSAMFEEMNIDEKNKEHYCLALGQTDFGSLYQEDHRFVVMGSPKPQSPNRQLLQVNIDSTGGLNAFNLYTRVPAQLQL